MTLPRKSLEIMSLSYTNCKCKKKCFRNKICTVHPFCLSVTNFCKILIICNLFSMHKSYLLWFKKFLIAYNIAHYFCILYFWGCEGDCEKSENWTIAKIIGYTVYSWNDQISWCILISPWIHPTYKYHCLEYLQNVCFKNDHFQTLIQH